MSFPNDLQLFFGDDYSINQFISVRHPKLDDIIRLGENEYYSIVYAFTSIPSDLKPQLWDIGICWEEISDFELFMMLTKNMPIESTRVFFGDNVDFTRFKVGQNQNGEPIMCQYDSNGNLIVIDESIYLRIATFLRKIHGITPKIEKAGSKIVRQLLIEDDRRKLEKQKKENKGSNLVPIVSALINSPEFKYGLDEIRKMPMYAFMDAVARVQIIRSTTALLHGSYSGMIDASKISKKEFNWMREIESDKK